MVCRYTIVKLHLQAKNYTIASSLEIKIQIKQIVQLLTWSANTFTKSSSSSLEGKLSTAAGKADNFESRLWLLSDNYCTYVIRLLYYQDGQFNISTDV